MPGEGQGLLALAQSTDIAWAMASICNDERGGFGVLIGHDCHTPPQYIAGMGLTTLIPRDPSCGRFGGSPLRLCCLGWAFALLAACSKPEPGAPAQPTPAAQASSATATPAATSAATSAAATAAATAAAPGPPPEPTAASASPASPAADAAPPAAATSASAAVAALPPAIAAFQKQRDACDHFRSEAPYDKQRAAFLKAQLAKTCKGSDRALAALRKRFAHHPDALAALKDYEGQIESQRPLTAGATP